MEDAEAGREVERAAERRSLLRSAGVMTAMTLVSRVLGLVREQVRAHYLGTGPASDAFGLAVLIPNLFRRLVAEGAMTAAFVPILAEYVRRGRDEETRAFLSRFFTLLTAAVAALTVLGVVLTPWIVETFFAAEFGQVPGKVALTIALTQVMWPYLFFVTIAAFLQAVLNTKKVFGPSAFTPVLLNLSIIVLGVALADVLPDPSYALAAGFLAGGVLQIAFQIPFLLRWTDLRFGLDRRVFGEDTRRVLRVMAPGAFAAGIYEVNVFVSQLIASRLEGGSIASLQYGIRLQELVLGLFVVSVAQVILPTLSEKTAAGDAEGVKDTLAYASGLMAFVTYPATAALVLLGVPIVSLLFEFGAFDADSTFKTAFALWFYAIGLFPTAMTRVQTQVFFARKDLRTPTLVSAISAAVNIALCVALTGLFPFTGAFEHGGIAAAGSIASAVSAVTFAVILRRRLGPGAGLVAALSRHGRLLLATAAMALALFSQLVLWPPDPDDGRLLLGIWVAVACVAGAAVYLAACRALGVDELRGVFSALRRRLGRRS